MRRAGAGLLAAALCWCAAPARSDTGTTALHFLDESIGARQAAAGGLHAVLADGADAIPSNPAGMGLLRRAEAALAYFSSHDQSRYAYSGYVRPFAGPRGPRWALGAGLLYYSAGNIDINAADGTTRSLNAESDFAGSLALSAGNEWLSVGAAPKIVRSTLVEQYRATAYAADVGVLVLPLPGDSRQNLILGASVRNLGTRVSYKSESQELPRAAAFGLAVRLFESGEYGSALLAGQAEQSTDEKIRYRAGGEYVYGRRDDLYAFFLRAGLRSHFDSESYSFGLGFRERNFQLDYAFVNGIELESTHRFTLAFRFGRYAAQKTSGKSVLIDIEEELRPGTNQLIPPASVPTNP